MPQLLSKQKYRLQALILGLLVALVARVVEQPMEWLNHETLTRLLCLFQNRPPEWNPLIHSSTTSAAVVTQAVSICLFAVAATWSGYRLAAVARLIVLLQLFVLSLLSSVGLWQLWHIQLHLLGCFAAILLGSLAGYGLRLSHQKQQKQESQYYELLLRNKELQEAKLLLVKQDEVDRRMLAADLHDQVLNDLKAARQKLDSYLTAPDPTLVEPIVSLINQAMDEIREVMDSLCPSALEHLGLLAAVEDCIRRGGQRYGFKVRLKSTASAQDLDSLSIVEQSLLYRMVQESVTNIGKHADAAMVRASIGSECNQIVITITDDGCGFAPDQPRGSSRGVRYMRQRADLIGATIAWHPGVNNKGTTVEIRINLTGRENVESSNSGRLSSTAPARSSPH